MLAKAKEKEMQGEGGDWGRDDKEEGGGEHIFHLSPQEICACFKCSLESLCELLLCKFEYKKSSKCVKNKQQHGQPVSSPFIFSSQSVLHAQGQNEKTRF